MTPTPPSPPSPPAPPRDNQAASASDGCPFNHHQDTAVPAPGQWPPGPPAGLTGWGLIAEMARDLPAALARWKRDYGDVVHLRIRPEHEVVIIDPALVRELLVNHHDALIRWQRATRVFEAAHGHSVLVVEGETWKDKRRALQPAFAPQQVLAFAPTIVEAAARRLALWPDHDACWPIENALTAVTMDVILRMMFSTSIGDEADAASRAIRDVGEAINAEFFWPVSLPDWLPWKRRKRRGIALLDRLVGAQVDQRQALARAHWPDDLLTRLLDLHATNPARWTLDAVRDECRTAFLAGHDTTAGALTWWAWLMASHPDAQARAAEEVQRRLRVDEGAGGARGAEGAHGAGDEAGNEAKAQAEASTGDQARDQARDQAGVQARDQAGVQAGSRRPGSEDLRHLSWLGQTLQETLRLYPSAPILFTRRALRPITLGRWQFPARTMFLLPVQLIQQDARWFDDPLAFRPERFDRQGDGHRQEGREAPRGTLLPFGAGPRVCLGQHLAMTEMTLIAAMVLQQFELAVPANQPPPVPRLQVTLKPATPLTLAIRRRR